RCRQGTRRSVAQALGSSWFSQGRTCGGGGQTAPRTPNRPRRFGVAPDPPPSGHADLIGIVTPSCRFPKNVEHPVCPTWHNARVVSATCWITDRASCDAPQAPPSRPAPLPCPDRDAGLLARPDRAPSRRLRGRATPVSLRGRAGDSKLPRV